MTALPSVPPRLQGKPEGDIFYALSLARSLNGGFIIATGPKSEGLAQSLVSVGMAAFVREKSRNEVQRSPAGVVIGARHVLDERIYRVTDDGWRWLEEQKGLQT